MNDNNIILLSHLGDLGKRAYEKNYNTFSDFLSLDEISALCSSKIEYKYRLYGGYGNAERCMAGFGEGLSDEAFPIEYLKIEPVNQRFSDELSHRDFLGAVLNLGISRSTLGDIIIGGNTAYLICTKSIAPFIADSISRVKHTTVKCTVAEGLPQIAVSLPEITSLTAASARADAVICAVYRLSRGAASELFERSTVFVNSRCITKSSCLLNDGDIVSVRGKGRFIFEGIDGNTKKGRCRISVRIYR